MPLTIAGSHARQVTAELSGQRLSDADWRDGRESHWHDVNRAQCHHLHESGASASLECEPAAQFSVSPLSQAQVATVVATARAAHQRYWQRPSEANLVILVSAFRVTGLPAGMYLAGSPERNVLTAVPDDEQDPELSVEYGYAAALLHICGDLEAACRVSGGPGYGTILVSAGALGQAAWLSAALAGLAGATYGVASNRTTRAARRVSPGLRHLMSVAIGRAASAPCG